MAMKENLLKALARDRHIQAYGAFTREYELVARKIDQRLISKPPSKAQFYRWLSGDVKGLPYSDHCRVLEAMFPPNKVQQLFGAADGSQIFVDPDSLRANHEFPIPSPGWGPPSNPLCDVREVFATRTAFAQAYPPDKLFAGAREICIAGLSNNMIAQHYSDVALLNMLNDGTEIKVLFLDPEGESIKAREAEESHSPGLLSMLTRINIQSILRLKTLVSQDSEGRLLVRTYDEPIRFNIIIVNQRTAVVQPYLPSSRGMDSPTMVIRRFEDFPNIPSLFKTFNAIFEQIWERSVEAM
ncbi:hypothetical protein JOF53_008000 [Crossiella equi]|uniref:DUF5919 domain-containing protein n=2 Tax=Crossiella equi TaxID=130796 RepID=A0ABS5ARC9_9PSEU|nr:hypothetical protein [Crossiella equi]